VETRIITAGDIFDAMTTGRPYRGPMPVPDTLVCMEKNRDAVIEQRCLDPVRAALPQLGLPSLISGSGRASLVTPMSCLLAVRGMRR